MGGAEAVIARAEGDFKAGNYRWVAQVMDQVVYAEPANHEARVGWRNDRGRRLLSVSPGMPHS
jgi:alkyl sulfatase BDS1-like metallo-beta-lactamase superfamily hydrolase